MVQDEIREKIDWADMVLVGLGEEFQYPASIKKQPEYHRGKEILQTEGRLWLLPAWDDYCARGSKADTDVVLQKFAELLAEKNYFVISAAMSYCVANAPWKQGRLVMPCGSAEKLQCASSCGENPVAVSEENSRLLETVMADLQEGKFKPEKLESLGKCGKCSSPMVLNNIYAEQYDESGYMEQWNLYTKWLQGTLNRRVLVLELGVGMQFPTVIRFPFEKVAYFNQKAEFYRINEKLYQLTEELRGKGKGISQNAIDCLRNL